MLARLQRMWVAFVGTVVVLSVLATLLADADSSLPGVLPAVLVLTLGLGSMVAVEAIDRGMMTTAPADDAAAFDEIRARLALQIAVGQAPALVAFALTFVLGPSWIALVGGAMTVVGLLRVRPTEARLRGIGRVWQAAGHEVSLLGGRDEPPTP